MSADQTDSPSSTESSPETEGTPEEPESRPGKTSDALPEPVRQGTPPTPVRAMMGKSETTLPAGDVSAEPPSRELELDGEAWTVHAIGHTRSGTAPDAGAPLLLVGFRRADESEEFEREALAVSESLEDLTELELASLFERSRPFRPLPAPEEREERRASPVSKDLGSRRRG